MTALDAVISSFPALTADGKIIVFPRVGGAGGVAMTTIQTAGNNGTAGSTNQTGGGGSGGAGDNSSFYSSDAGDGTCFSGGVGSGGRKPSTPASDYAGAGGDGNDTTYDSAGTGNPSGAGKGTELNGTGGLLIIICSGNITGSGTIESKGVLSQDGHATGFGAGGASGGGAILVARVGTDATVSKSTAGGVGGITTYDGGDGGAGTIQTLQVSA